MNPRVEEARIRKALKDCERRGFQIYSAEECVKRAVEEYGDSLAVSCSFGSCSVAVLHMAIQFKPDIKVIFNNTGVEYEETYAYRDLLKKEWNLNLIETKPIKSFWQCLKEYGFPLFRGKYDKSRGYVEGKPKCCLFLKEYPFRDAIRKYGVKATLTGLRAGESRVRMFIFSEKGQNYFVKKYGLNIMKFNPIAFWTHKQVWSYLHAHNIPINQVYLKGAERSGCQPCTAFQNWEAQLSKINLRMYKYIQHLKGQMLMDDYPSITEQEDRLFETCSQISSLKQRQALLEEWFGF